MAEKNFWQDKWLKDQLNERNPGQRNDPNRVKEAKPETPKPLSNADDVLRVMLNTPPQPHKPGASKPRKKKQIPPK